jgi:hypothetical protein
MNKNDLFESLIAERNKKFNGVRLDLGTEQVPAEIQEIMTQKNKSKKTK